MEACRNFGKNQGMTIGQTHLIGRKFKELVTPRNVHLIRREPKGMWRWLFCLFASPTINLAPDSAFASSRLRFPRDTTRAARTATRTS